ncbi:MAG: hypothetical protein ACE5E7_13710 [Anaerolineae bacterium]
MLTRGAQPGGMLSTEQVQKYRHQLAQAEVIEFKESGHELWIPNYEIFINVIMAFLGQIDNTGKLETDA